MNVSFQDILVFAEIEKDTKEFVHYKLDEVMERYDSNFIEFKTMPTIEQLQESQAYLKNFHQLRGQQFLKFVFPQDQEIPLEITHYLTKHGYTIGNLELYIIEPNRFTKQLYAPNVQVEVVSANTLERYLAFHFDEDLEWGESYAKSKYKMLMRDFTEQRRVQVIAKMGGEVVGVVDVIEAENTVEIDSLSVHPNYQRQGIGTKIQQFVMEHYPKKTIILVADGEDTPREMYKKQGYSYVGNQYNALKISLD